MHLKFLFLLKLTFFLNILQLNSQKAEIASKFRFKEMNFIGLFNIHEMKLQVLVN